MVHLSTVDDEREGKANACLNSRLGLFWFVRATFVQLRDGSDEVKD